MLVDIGVFLSFEVYLRTEIYPEFAKLSECLYKRTFTGVDGWERIIMIPGSN